MGKLVNLKPSVGSLAPLIGYQPGDEKARNRYRAGTQPWRQWYNTSRWQQLRKKVLLRDMYVCQMSGELCIQRSPHPLSPVVDHKRPHRGDPALFWDENNLQTLAKCVHDKLKQRGEREGPGGGSV